MRRIDREILDKKEIYNILKNASTIRVAFKGNEYPYLLPFSFGLDLNNEKPIVYIHSALEGLKISYLKEDSHVCVEVDEFKKIEETAHGITTRYLSVVGFGNASIILDPLEKKTGLKTILNHYGKDDYPLDRCKGLDHMLIIKIVLDKLTGKKNIN